MGFRRGLLVVTAGVALLVTAFTAFTAFAAMGSGGTDTLPNPRTILKKVLKKLARAQSFEVSCNVVGGISKTEDHDVCEVTVYHEYAGRYYRPFLFMPEENAYRTSTKGAIRQGSNWVRIRSVRHGGRIDSFFQLPQKLLWDAMERVGKVEWVEVVDEDPDHLAGPGRTDEDDDEDTDENETKKGDAKESPTRGRTVVVWDEKKSGKPHVIRVTLPVEVSRKRWAEVVKSGCFENGL